MQTVFFSHFVAHDCLSVVKKKETSTRSKLRDKWIRKEKFIFLSLRLRRFQLFLVLVLAATHNKPSQPQYELVNFTSLRIEAIKESEATALTKARDIS